MKRILFSTLIFLLFLSSPLAIPEAKAADHHSDEVKLIAVRMYADWCGYCKELDGKLDEVKGEFKDTGVWFTYFDITDDFMHQQTRIMADKLDLMHVYEQYHDQTGTMLLVNPENGEIVKEITSGISEEDLVAEIHSHL